MCSSVVPGSTAIYSEDPVQVKFLGAEGGEGRHEADRGAGSAVQVQAAFARRLDNRQVDYAAEKLCEQRIDEINEELVGLDAVIKARDEDYRDHPEWGSC